MKGGFPSDVVEVIDLRNDNLQPCLVIRLSL